MYKLLVLDMDGTLLNEKQKISPLDCEAVKRAIKIGINVVIATGRTKQGIDPYLKELGLEGPEHYSILCSGAHITRNDNMTMAYHSLSHDDFSEIYMLKSKHNLTINVYSDDKILIEQANYYSKFDAIANNLPLIKIDLEHVPKDIPLLKVMLVNEDLSMVNDFKRIFPSMDIECPPLLPKDHYDKNLFKDFAIFSPSFLNRFNVSRVTPYNIEISSKYADKRYGVEKIATHLSIKQEEIMCIGDSGNDFKMIEYAGLGIAMGNAFPEIKALADDMTDSNMNNGVAKAINKYLFNKSNYEDSVTT